MTITVTFNSLEEMDQFCNGIMIAPRPLPEKAAAVPVKETTRKKEKPAKEEAAQEKADPVKETPVEEPPAEETTYTLEDVRAKLGALQKAGHRDDVKKLLQSVGAEKLPEVDPKDYGTLMQKAGELDA